MATNTAIDRLMRQALGDAWGAAGGIADVDELVSLLQAAGIVGPVTPIAADFAAVPSLPRRATEAHTTAAYRRVLAQALLRLALQEKRRRAP
jgi:hypothetical protein